MITDCRKDSVKLVAKDRQTRLSRHSSLTLGRDVQSNDSGDQIVAMMQPAESWHRYNPSTYTGLLLSFTTGKRYLRQREMSSILMIVPNVLVHQTVQMTLIEHDHMIEQVPAAVANPAFSNTVLPRTS